MSAIIDDLNQVLTHPRFFSLSKHETHWSIQIKNSSEGNTEVCDVDFRRLITTVLVVMANEDQHADDRKNDA